MILYISENKVNNLLDEIQIKQRIRFSSFDTIKLSLSGLETEAKVNELAQMVGVSRQSIWEWLTKDKDVKAELDRRLQDINRSANLHLRSQTDTKKSALARIILN